MVGAVLVRNRQILGRGWHHQAGAPHAEIEAILDRKKEIFAFAGATLYVTLKRMHTHGRTPPCTHAIISTGIKRVVAGATDPNPKHRGKAFQLLRLAGIQVVDGLLSGESGKFNEAWNHWIVHGTPFVTVKAAMTLDGKIATATGESKWITGEKARAYGMKLRQGADAILVGINTVLADDPGLTVRLPQRSKPGNTVHRLRRIVLDAAARTSPIRKWLHQHAALTTVVVSRAAPQRRVAALTKRVTVLVAPARQGKIDLGWLLRHLGSENVTSLLVEGGGEVNGSFLSGHFAHRVAFLCAQNSRRQRFAPRRGRGRSSNLGRNH